MASRCKHSYCHRSHRANAATAGLPLEPELEVAATWWVLFAPPDANRGVVAGLAQLPLQPAGRALHRSRKLNASAAAACSRSLEARM